MHFSPCRMQVCIGMVGAKAGQGGPDGAICIFSRPVGGWDLSVLPIHSTRSHVPEMMPIQWAALGFACLPLALIFLRDCWRMLQVKPAIRQVLEVNSVKVLKVTQAGVWRNCGSCRAALYSSLTIRDYHVDCQAPDGTTCLVFAEARFHPFWATLQEIKFTRSGKNEEAEIYTT